MKIVICTTPIRPLPTNYPPFGSMAIIQALRKAGYNPHFYDIDGLRPSIQEVEKYFRDEQPDVVGISAVVSTAYAYTKDLARMIRRVSPKTKIILGGNLAASAEILHRLGGIDVCVIGEGEIIVVNLMRALEQSNGAWDLGLLSAVRGLSFLNAAGEMIFTGYETRLPAEEVFDPDFSILENFSSIDNFIKDADGRPDFLTDPRASEPHRRGKKLATLVTAKGCVARCTFCHRWDKGYRAVPVDQIIEKLKYLIDKYNVGFVMFSDENFGSDKKHVEEFLTKIKPFDILWNVGGVRVRTASPELLRKMREAGCCSMYYGMETGSTKILEIMEKKASSQDNLNAARWTQEANIFTIYQMILGMPGETGETIQETIEFLKKVTQDRSEPPRSLMSLNYIQALPGTPVYEFARVRGLIGRTLLEEEKYLISISDTNAQDDTKMPNYTDVDYLTLRSWRRKIVMEVMHHYYEYNNIPIPGFFTFITQIFKKKLFTKRNHSTETGDSAKELAMAEYGKGGYFNLSRDLGYDVIVAYFYPFRNLICAAFLVWDEFRRLPLSEFSAHIAEWLKHRFGGHAHMDSGAVSVRQTMASLAPKPLTETERSMQPLREGR